MQTFTFITGNDNKARELSEILGKDIKRQKLDLDELQTLDTKQIVEHKLKQAYHLLNSPVLCEDVSLIFHALGNLPGPFIKWFNQEIGVDNYPAFLSPYQNKKITATCLYGLFDGTNINFFEGVVDGTMATKPKGENGFGFNRILIPDGFDITMAEMSSEQKNSISHRGKALAKLKQFLYSN